MPLTFGAVMEKLALLLPAGTVTELGTTAPLLSPLTPRLMSEAPPALDSVTVHWVVPPGARTMLSQPRETIWTAASKIVAVCVVPFRVAVMVAV